MEGREPGNAVGASECYEAVEDASLRHIQTLHQALLLAAWIDMNGGSDS